MVHSILRFIWTYRKIFIVLLVPLILLPLPLVSRTTEASCGYVILLMAIYWITEALPLAVTSLIPLMLFPMTGILKASQVGVLYFKDTNWLMFGGLMIAVAVETSGLHKRIALGVLLIVGVKPRWLMIGFMFVTFFLSMWISNTATTAMLIPIVEAIVKELYGNVETKSGEEQYGHLSSRVILMRKIRQKKQSNDEYEAVNQDEITSVSGIQNPAYSAKDDDVEGEKNELPEIAENPQDDPISQDGGEQEGDSNSPTSVEIKFSTKDDSGLTQQQKINIIKGITICVPYAASIGGTATLTGTVPNLVLSGQYDVLFPDSDVKLSFGIWIVYCLPQAIVMLILAYIWLSCWFIGFRNVFSCCFRGNQTSGSFAEERGKHVIKREYRKLGPIKWEEVTVLVVFGLTALLWFFRNPGYMTGWSIIFPEGFVSDGTVAVFMAFLLFILPQHRPEFLRKSSELDRYRDGKTKYRSVPAILQWPKAQRMFPWEVSLLLGAGFAIAGAATASGLSVWFGEQLSVLKGIDDRVICLTMTTFVCLMTETTSNTATASLFVPILAELAKTLEVHPLYMLYPPVIAASLAFMLPVATPPNAIAFSYGRITVWDLVKAGWAVNILGILTLTLFINTYGVAFFDLRQFPSWANSTAEAVATTAAPCIPTTTI